MSGTHPPTTEMPASNRSFDYDVLLTAVHGWHLRPSRLNMPKLRERWLSRLPADERVRYRLLQTDRMRENFLASRVLRRTTLSRYTGYDPCGWRFGKDPNDKPKLVEPADFNSLRFNLTHTTDLVVCAITRMGEVGVDAEDISQPVDAPLVARHFFSRRTQGQLATLAPDARAAQLFERWVLKEAYVKATGKGLASSDERLTIEQRDDGRPIAIEGCVFSLYRPTPNHVAAAAVLSRNRAHCVSFEWFIAEERDLC